MDGSYVTGGGAPRSGTIFDREPQVVIVHDGSRGPKGVKGDEGDPGPKGSGINVLGAWTSGTVYKPNDAVTAESSLVQGISSLYIQRNGTPTTVSTTPPGDDPARWVEVGALDWDNAFGGIWEVSQIGHGFTKIGQPVAFSWQANRYVLADARNEDELAIGVVREVVDADRVILQSTGEVPNIDPEVIYPDGSVWEPGRTYFVGTVRGRVQIAPPNDLTYFVNPILRPTDQGFPGLNGVVLPWTPTRRVETQYLPVGMNKFYFTLAAPSDTISGADDNTNLLAYIPGANTEVFVDGLNLFEDQYTALDGSTITFPAPYPIGTKIEVWTPDRPLDILVKATTLKLDNIEHLFDDVEDTFDLTYLGQPTVFQETSSALIWLDGNPQEPGVDYEIVQSTTNVLWAAVRFLAPPEAGTRFWGIALSPSGASGLPAGGGTGDIIVKVSPADGDATWSDILSGGTF